MFCILPVNFSFECSGTLVCLPITHILLFSPIHLVVPSSIYINCISLHRVLTQVAHLTFIYRALRSFKGNVHLIYYHSISTLCIQHIKLVPCDTGIPHFKFVLLLFHLNAPAKSTSYHYLHNQLLPFTSHALDLELTGQPQTLLYCSKN